MRTPLVLLLSSLLLPTAACAQLGSGSKHTAPRSAVVDARGASALRVHARAGSLRIVGRPGLSEVRVTGTARANKEKYLEGIRLVADRRGGEVKVAVEWPEVTVFFGSVNRALDLVLEVPAELALDVKDSSGDLEVRGVAALRLDDSSGDVEVEDVRGDVRVDDSSGDVSLLRVGGDIWLSDRSGDLRVAEVGGGVVVDRDGSGEIDVRNVRGSVAVREDGSGAIRVSDVGGDFLVDDDGSGGVRATRVAGRVRIPR